MKSITYWNRLQPRPRAGDALHSLQARVRDPLWFLTRQWQFGEFQGEDAASPAWVQMAWRTSPFTHWAPRGQALQPLPDSLPLEDLAESESFTPTLAMRVELGQLAESLLDEQGVVAAWPKLLGAFRLPERSEAELAADTDAAQSRLWRLAGGRSVDGVLLARAYRASAPGLPPELLTAPHDVAPALRAGVAGALQQLLDYIDAVYGDIGEADAPGWRAERLEYDVDVQARQADGQVLRFDAEPGADGGFDWHSFDVLSRREASPQDGPAEVMSQVRSVVPNHVRFRGMPNARWWSFESSRTDFGAIQPDRRDLGRLLAVDFMTVAGNDWFVAPLVLPMGSLCEIDLLLVHDVFGGRTHVPRANDTAALNDETRRWAMYAHEDGAGLARFFAVPPVSATARIDGDELEQVRFIRDEMANMVWAIEHLVEGGAGEGVSGHELAVAGGEVRTEAPTTGGPALAYQLETAVPAHWIPMLPVAIDPLRRDIALERGAVVRRRDDGSLYELPPRGRILRPTGVSPYRLREEEVTRAGTRVARVVMRSRWWDGSTAIWVARRTGAGAGEGSSGLAYDLAKSRAGSP